MKLFEHHLACWSLQPDGDPFETPSSHLLFVRSAEGPAVLKILKPPFEEAPGAAALRQYAGQGAARLIAADAHAMLIHRALPGTPLSARVRAGHDDEATAVVCDIAAALHARGAPSGPGPWSTVEEWGEAFADHHGRLPAGLVAEAQRCFDDLCRSQTTRVLLHGDLHHDNILHDALLGWLAIDPKGVVGEPAYEFGAALRNPTGLSALYADPDVMRRRVGIICARSGFAANRVLRWCFAQAVLSAIWLVEDEHDETEIATVLKVAQTARRLIK